MSNLIDITGMKFGKLTALCHGDGKWKCLCECGNTRNVRRQDLLQSKQISCGCAHKHGYSKSRLYKIWHGIRQKCLNTYSEHYREYNTFYNPWNKFMTFREWALEAGYDDTKAIHRVVTKNGFNPENCEFK